MGRYYFDEVQSEDDDEIFDGGGRGTAKRDNDQPKRSPMRRKDKMRNEEKMRSKAKRNHKREQHRIKYEWQGE
jgi:hypothetical protein